MCFESSLIEVAIIHCDHIDKHGISVSLYTKCDKCKHAIRKAIHKETNEERTIVAS